jgi:hypothetical protein
MEMVMRSVVSATAQGIVRLVPGATHLRLQHF